MANKRHWLRRLFRRSAGNQGDPDGVLSPETSAALNSSTILSSPQLSLRQTLREAWRLSKPYFTASPDKNRARLLLGGITGLTLNRPDQDETMIRPFSLMLKPDDRLVLTGVIGSGKSSLLRSISGLWDHGQGNIEVGAAAKVLCVPQKPYLPLQSLRGIVCYPHPAGEFSDEQVEDALRTAGLARLIPYLDDEERDGAYWAGSLSGGEQQRVGFARIFLHKPDILLLDEVTSSMDPQAEKDMYQAVIDKLPGTIIISVAHREKVLHFHTLHGHISEQTLNISSRPLLP